MSDETTKPEIEERMPDGLRYTETIDATTYRRTRLCDLHRDGEKDPVSSLRLVTLKVRFGATALDAEGVASVQTRPEHRRRGHNAALVRRALQGAAARVPVMFLFGIEGLYPKYGFATCLAETAIAVWVRRTRVLAAPDGWTVREAQEPDLAALIGLYNELHAARPWTCVREAAMVKRFQQRTPWAPTPDVVLFERKGEIRGYTVVAHRQYGWTDRTFKVLEAGARDAQCARVVLRELARRCRDEDLEQFSVDEPADGAFGLTARAVGCAVTETTSADGGGMGLLLDRAATVNALAPELLRSAHTGARDTADLRGLDAALRRLADGELVPDAATLLRLLVGYRSWEQAVALDECTETEQTPLFRLLFPGGGTPALPTPYAHRLDRY